MSVHRPRKRFGQHFLVDEGVVEAILRAMDPRDGDRVVEIGPGRSALTGPLIRAAGQLTAIEIDRDLARALRAAYPEERLILLEQDVLRTDFSALGEDLRIVGNLPYNISSPLLFHLSGYADRVRDQHFMLQREVVDRIVAQPSSSEYGRLSVMLQSRYRISKLFDVTPDAFDPPPAVVSAVMRMVPLPDSRLKPIDQGFFEQVVLRAFAQRRKMLRSGLGDWARLVDWKELGIAETARPQQLGVQEFIALADHLLNAGASRPLHEGRKQ